MRRTSDTGFTLIEMMVIVAIMAVLSAIAIPNWQRMNDNIRLREAARTLSGALSYTRQQSIMQERSHILFYQVGAAVDICGNAVPAPVTVLDDTNGNCCFDAGETFVNYFTEPAMAATVGWGLSNSTVPVPEDPGVGAFAGGSSFLTQLGAPTSHVAFRPDGVAVVFDNTCTGGQVGTGGGGLYFTNARVGVPLGARRDLAVVLTPLGASKIYQWDNANGVWTQ